MNLENIYDQYREADLTDRLNIYLQFPELRNAFLEIEQQAAQSFPFKSDNPRSESRSKQGNGPGKLISRIFSI